MSIEFKTPEEFCDLFGVDRRSGGTADFCAITGIAATLKYYGLPGSAYAAALFLMRARHWSPLVMWKRMRGALRPALDAGRDTLAALGVVIPDTSEGEGFTVCQLAAAVAAALAAEGYAEVDRVAAEQIANDLRQGRGK
jgi:hypothetical protein